MEQKEFTCKEKELVELYIKEFNNIKGHPDHHYLTLFEASFFGEGREDLYMAKIVIRSQKSQDLESGGKKIYPERRDLYTIVWNNRYRDKALENAYKEIFRNIVLMGFSNAIINNPTNGKTPLDIIGQTKEGLKQLLVRLENL